MIKAKIISEVLGSPQEHVDKTLNLLLEKIKEVKDLRAANWKVFEAQKIEDKPLFTGFLEYEISVETIEHLVGFCFDFMPSSIEIIEPDEFQIPATDTGNILNDLLARLHQNDMFLRNVVAELTKMKKVLENK